MVEKHPSEGQDFHLFLHKFMVTVFKMSSPFLPKLFITHLFIFLLLLLACSEMGSHYILLASFERTI